MIFRNVFCTYFVCQNVKGKLNAKQIISFRCFALYYLFVILSDLLKTTFNVVRSMGIKLEGKNRKNKMEKLASLVQIAC
jgi:hypothetical protein